MSKTTQAGLLIAFDGIDGTGKTTHSRLLGEWLSENGFEILTSKEPTDGQWGRLLRESALEGRLSPADEVELFLKDRKEHVTQLIQPALHKGKTVILDRYFFSNMAYQGAVGYNPTEIRSSNEQFAPTPDFLFILDLDTSTALTRIDARGDKANEFEKKENLERCREIFLSLENEAFAYVIDTTQSIENVQNHLRTIVGKRLGI